MKNFILCKPLRFVLLAALCATIITVLFIVGLIFQPIITWIILGIIFIFCVFVGLITYGVTFWLDKNEKNRSKNLN